MRKGRVPEIVRNRYFLSASVFIVWITFFDSNNLINQIQLRYEIWKLNQKISYYHQELTAIRKQRDALFSTPVALEKYAREQYKMKRDNEDLFLIIQKQ